MSDRLSDDQLVRLREFLVSETALPWSHIVEAVNAVPALLAEVDQLRAENERLREHGCAHVVTDPEGTSHCSLAERQVREVERQRDAYGQTNE